MSGDDVGVWFEYDTDEGEADRGEDGCLVREHRERPPEHEHGAARLSISTRCVRRPARCGTRICRKCAWWKAGRTTRKTIFYTGMYHLLIHPNILQDVNGEYPMMESLKVGHTTGNRYTVFSLVGHVPQRQHPDDLALSGASAWTSSARCWTCTGKAAGLPKWELYGRETLDDGGRSVDPVYRGRLWMRGLRDFR